MMWRTATLKTIAQKDDMATNQLNDKRSGDDPKEQPGWSGDDHPKERPLSAERGCSARRTISAMAFGNPPSGMIADPERHARDSQLATESSNFRSRWVFLVTRESRIATRKIWTLFRWAIRRPGSQKVEHTRMKEEGWGKEEKKITFRQVTGTKGNRN
ncbi:hypothetical protein GEV33_015224 [Tenebrio molitor]|uniref:Uncharacterized protein n=1 Tax=Tenebrio molitor TaxID=7067 RepID=A0A8J6H454_TENMO|nr:hypothetical protein GEV33_015227 [Tenebrio molitor]KAH0807565.1 hypothetical protein GEV33_015226 [Tenebrio molitor]KAH0807566.1 hypothetical protein GEV33_015225 [Tenebrio molitor]KAH0807567.1 hypothetical protein GEV33_015224 [Tenebrio molitor]